MNPFDTEIIILRVPLAAGERTISQLKIKPPKLKDMIRTDQYPSTSFAYARALLSSLTGEPEVLLDEMVPEDWADCLVVLNRTVQRFAGIINLLDTKDEPTDPTKAGTPPNSLEKTSGE